MLAIGSSCRAGDRLSAVLAIGGLSEETTTPASAPKDPEKGEKEEKEEKEEKVAKAEREESREE